MNCDFEIEEHYLSWTNKRSKFFLEKRNPSVSYLQSNLGNIWTYTLNVVYIIGMGFQRIKNKIEGSS